MGAIVGVEVGDDGRATVGGTAVGMLVRVLHPTQKNRSDIRPRIRRSDLFISLPFRLEKSSNITPNWHGTQRSSIITTITIMIIRVLRALMEQVV
jgi:hypothetical protein